VSPALCAACLIPRLLTLSTLIEFLLKILSISADLTGSSAGLYLFSVALTDVRSLTGSVSALSALTVCPYCT